MDYTIDFLHSRHLCFKMASPNLLPSHISTCRSTRFSRLQITSKGNKMQKLHLAALSGNELDVKKLLSKGVGKLLLVSLNCLRKGT